MRYPLEIQNVVRLRLRQFLIREGISRYEFAEEISLWRRLPEWDGSAEAWQAQYPITDGDGFVTTNVESEQTKARQPITQRMLDRWLTGDPARDGSSTRETRAPGNGKLDAIAHYLIEVRRVLDRRELQPDDRGFALSNALQSYIGSDAGSLQSEEWEGTFEAIRQGKEWGWLHKLRVAHLADGTTFVVYGRTRGPLSWLSLKPTDRAKYSNNGVLKETQRSGWGLKASKNDLLALIKSPFDATSIPRCWVFRFDTQGLGGSYVLISCGDMEQVDDFTHITPTPLLTFAKTLQVNTEIDYPLQRSGSNTGSIIGRIVGMKDFEEATKAKGLSDLDREFLEAAYDCFGDFTEIEELLEKGANINAIDPLLQETALLTAAREGSDVVVDFLLKHPAIDVLIRNGQGYLASEMALFYLGRVDLADKLVDIECAEELIRKAKSIHSGIQQPSPD